MTITRKFLVTSSALVVLSFMALLALSKHSYFGTSSAPENNPEPLPYESVGNYPVIEDSPAAPIRQDKEFTLELGVCYDKPCISKTLKSLNRKGVEAFYTPSKLDGKLIFRIRRGIFNSRLSAERAQALLSKEKKIPANVVEL